VVVASPIKQENMDPLKTTQYQLNKPGPGINKRNYSKRVKKGKKSPPLESLYYLKKGESTASTNSHETRQLGESFIKLLVLFPFIKGRANPP
jgi:hypothetical protein